MLLICQQNSSTLPFKCNKILWVCGLLWPMLCYVGREFQLAYSSTDISKAKSRAPFVILQCFLSQRWFLIVLSHSSLEQAQFRKTRWLLRSAWVKFLLWQLSSTWKLKGLDNMPPNPLLFLLFLPVHLQALPLGHFQKLNFLQGELDRISATIQHSQIPSISFHVVSHERM